MALAPGMRLGPYEITAQIGVGGMGEVYRARDTNLDRQVAIKILPDAFAQDPERLARFEREAKTVASLNHPNIAIIYGLERVDGGVRALVMELVEGPTLAERIAQGPIPADDALAIARQIAVALEAAHEQGIIHRDLKPANIKVTPNGDVKVLDFGLAKAIEPTNAAMASATMSPTITRLPMTGVGVLLGTAAYMSPEQARGRAVDKRTDIWAFGCVLYEMLTGRRVFDGEDAADVLARVIEREVDFTALPETTPEGVRRLLRRSLQKNYKNRLTDVGVARLEIDDALLEPAAKEPIRPPERSTSHVERLAWLAAVVVAVATAGVAGRYVQRTTSESSGPIRFLVSPPQGALFEPTYLHHAISPDGQRLAFLARSRPGTAPLVWVRALDAVAATALAGTEDANTVFWSPDSQFLGFFAQDKLKKIAATGGPVQVLADAPGAGGGTWSEDGTIVFGPVGDAANLWRVSASGGTPSAVTTLDTAKSEIGHSLPQFLPGGRRFLFYARPQNDVYVASLDDGVPPKRLLTADSKALYARPGYLLFIRQGTLWGQLFASDRGELTGQPFVIADGVRFNAANGGGGFSVSDNGVLTYRGGEAGQIVQLYWYDRAGKQVGTLGEPGTYRQMTLSPDGRQLALERWDMEASGSDIWLLDVTRGVSTRFTFDPAIEVDPVWSPDSRYIAFAKRQKNTFDIFRKSVENGDETVLLQSREDKYPENWSADGQWLTYLRTGGSRQDQFALVDERQGALGILPLANPQKAYPYLETPFAKDEPQFSPDGHWIGYMSNESGRYEIYVQPFPGPGAKVRVSTGGGGQPKWRRDGKELFYIGLDGMLMSVDIRQAATLAPGNPKPLFQTPINVQPNLDQYAPSLDGEKFLVMAPSGGENESPIVVELNWSEELIRLAAATTTVSPRR